MDDAMRCDQIREEFRLCEQPPEHVRDCPDCRLEWEVHLSLRQFQAPKLEESFDQLVLAQLQQRGLFDPPAPTFLQRLSQGFAKLLTPATILACLLLLLWLGDLAATRPAPELRALRPDRARLWSSLPDAVPPPAFPGPAPSRVRRPLVKADQP